MRKLFDRLLIDRIRTRTDDVLGEEQCSFRSGSGCVDKLFVVSQLCEKFLIKGKDLFWVFMDLEMAYDIVDWYAHSQVLI